MRQTEALARRAGATPARRPVTQSWVDDDAVGEVSTRPTGRSACPPRSRAVRGGCRIELVVRSETELAALAGRLGEVAELVETHILR